MGRISNEKEEDYKQFITDSQDFYKDSFEDAWNLLVFRDGDHWGQSERINRGDDRPCLTQNELLKFVDRFKNPYIQHPYRSQAKAKQKKHEVFEKAINDILDNSINSQEGREAHQSAFGNGGSVGYGYFKAMTKYRSDESLEQDVCLEFIEDHRMLVLPANEKSVDGSGINRFGFIDLITKDEAEEYGEGVYQDTWVDTMYSSMSMKINEGLVPCFYMYSFKKRKVQRAFYIDGSYTDEFVDPSKILKGVREVEARDLLVEKYIGQEEVFSETYDNCPYMPLFPVLGDLIYTDKSIKRGGIVNRGKDLQMMIDIDLSSAAEMINDAPMQPYMVDANSIADHDDEWNEATSVKKFYLPYDSVVDGERVNAPIRNDNVAQTAGLTAHRVNLMESLKSVTGMSDNSFGEAVSGQQSGTAINLLTKQSEIPTANYVGNYEKTLSRASECCVGLNLSVNDPIVEIEQEGQKIPVRLKDYVKASDFDYDLSNGPANESKKQIMLNFMQLVGNFAPEKLTNMIDLLAENQDLPKEFVDRLKRLLPPDLQDLEEESVENLKMQVEQLLQVAQEAQVMAEQHEKYIQMLETEIISGNADREAGLEETRLKIIADLHKNKENNETKVEVEQIKQGNENLRTAAKLEEDTRKDIDDRVERFVQKQDDTLKELSQEANIQGDVVRGPQVIDNSE